MSHLIEKGQTVSRSGICCARGWHCGGPQLQREQATLRFASVNETGLAVGPSPDGLAAHYRRLNLAAVDKSDHSQGRRRAIVRARGRNGLPNEFGSLPRLFLSKRGVNPRACPCVLDPFCERRGGDPEGARAVGQENAAAASRGELGRADLLAVIVAISKARGDGIGTVRRAPSHLRHVACQNALNHRSLALVGVCAHGALRYATVVTARAP